MTHHDHLRHMWRLALVVGLMLGLGLGTMARAQTQPPANRTPLNSISISGKASGSETNQTSAADYTVKFTLPPDRVLDPPTMALRLRIEPDVLYPDPCADVAIPAGCFVPSAGGFAVADPAGCGVSVVAFNADLTYAQDQTPLLQKFSATLQQVKGEWQARLVTAFTEAVAQPAPCAITFTIGENGVERVPISSSDAKFRATLP